MKRESAAAASKRGHPCSCGRVIHGNGYARHRLVCGGTWVTWTAWADDRDPRCGYLTPARTIRGQARPCGVTRRAHDLVRHRWPHDFTWP